MTDEWAVLADELNRTTPWRPEDIKRALNFAQTAGYDPGRVRAILVTGAEAVNEFDRLTNELRQAMNLSPAETLGLAERVRLLAASKDISVGWAVGELSEDRDANP